MGWDFGESVHCVPLVQEFQSLGRDSVGWDSFFQTGKFSSANVSIPRSGFCGVGPFGNQTVVLEQGVSIPRSGFCGVGLNPFCFLIFLYWVSIPRSGFCGVGHTTSPLFTRRATMFQSLGRDSVGWDSSDVDIVSFSANCFNPSVGILWGGTRATCCSDCPTSGFNPSVGILWGGTQPSLPPGREKMTFQSLGRDSVGWDPLSCPVMG